MQCRDNISEEASAPAPIRAALAPLLPADAAVPVRIHRIPEGIVAAYNPAAETRESVWQLLTELFGRLTDVTPAVAL